MSKLSEFCDDLRTVKPGEQATLTHEGVAWLLSEIDRIQNVAKQALLAQRAAEKNYNRRVEVTDELAPGED